ncbi:hypothetical protein B484DRAFT_454945 [Ochromonadaceae sp. CCMP2298]|nr:hypothetical protein B484DRAFT_454945 [Ochromonadaceae sp. CCMP2298]
MSGASSADIVNFYAGQEDPNGAEEMMSSPLDGLEAVDHVDLDRRRAEAGAGAGADPDGGETQETEETQETQDVEPDRRTFISLGSLGFLGFPAPAPAPSGARYSASAPSPSSTSSTSSTSIQLRYQVRLHSQGSYASLSKQLSSNVQGGVFDSYLAALALASAPALAGATSDTVTTQNLEEVTTQSEGSLSLGAGPIAGIAAALALAALVVAALAAGRRRRASALVRAAGGGLRESELSAHGDKAEGKDGAGAEGKGVGGPQSNPIHHV